jgi:predicted RNA binding protein with dsRBD fold (UPF0201 family)
MFAMAVLCFVGFGWIFTKVLMGQNKILNDIREILAKQVVTDDARSKLADRVEATQQVMMQELFLHRQAMEGQPVSVKNRRMND